MGLKLPRRLTNGAESKSHGGLRLPRHKMVGGDKQGAAYKRSAPQEKSVAKRLNASVVRGSGRLIEKGDVRVRKIMKVECKTTEQKSYRFTLEDFTKLSLVAHSAGEEPVFVIEFINKRGKVLGELAVMQFSTLQEVLCQSSED